ncbi:hypothetical protein GYMLUDRAFT_727526 [Collybiopsis luxurians FD-317 M1]|nr:hypothetical protein GYMLUDRAFT_727526 [Collybiopsis luxurians FD-317 M1]
MSPGLEGVPLDVFLELVSFLEVHDALSLTLISRKFHVLRSHNSFWHILLRTLHHSSVPLASPPHSELIGDVKDLTLRTLKRQKAMFSSSNPRPVRVRKYLECRHDSICPISGTTMYLTCDLKDGMARCWDLPKGECLSEVYIGRNILAQSTVAADKGMFLVCLLLAESLQEFVATSVVVLCLKYDLDVDLSQSSSFSYSNVRLSVLHRSPLDVTYPAMYPSCAINPDGVVAITKMATSIHIIGINVFHETSCVIETDLTVSTCSCLLISTLPSMSKISISQLVMPGHRVCTGVRRIIFLILRIQRFKTITSIFHSPLPCRIQVYIRSSVAGSMLPVLNLYPATSTHLPNSQ